MRRKVLRGRWYGSPHFLHRGLCPPSRPKSRPWGRLALKRFAAARSLDAKFSRLTAQKFCCHPRSGKRQKPTACRFRKKVTPLPPSHPQPISPKQVAEVLHDRILIKALGQDVMACSHGLSAASLVTPWHQVPSGAK